MPAFHRVETVPERCSLLKFPENNLCVKLKTHCLQPQTSLSPRHGSHNKILAFRSNKPPQSGNIQSTLFEEILDRVMAVAPKYKFKFKNPLYAIGSTTTDLYLSHYNWAYYRKQKGAGKRRTEFDLSGNLSCFLLTSNGKMPDIRAAKENIPILPDSSAFI